MRKRRKKGMKGEKGGIYQDEVERVKEEGKCEGMERRNYGEEEERLRNEGRKRRNEDDVEKKVGGKWMRINYSMLRKRR
jgi:hypothetical protein